MTDFLDLVKQRVSCRSYLSKDVSEEVIDYCLDAARHAPSACNKQPWKFIIVKDKSLREQICSKALLPGIPMPWLKEAPVIIVLCAETSLITHTLAPTISKVRYHMIDIGIAGEHFVLAAENKNLGSCWIGWFKHKQIKRILSIPKSVEVLSLISLGYPKEAATPTVKKEISEIAYRNTWN